MKKVLIVGKNSFYYSEVSKLLKNNFLIYEISHLDINTNLFPEIKKWDIILIFCRVKKSIFFNRLFFNYSSELFILLSSRILDLPNTYRFYSYYKEKLQVENWFKSYCKNSLIIRSGTLEGGCPVYSKKNQFIECVTNSYNDTISLDLFSKHLILPNFLYRKLFSIKYIYILLRPFDIFYKYRPNFIYGYVYAISKHLIIKN
jgi:hypothetical protein